MDDRQRFRQTRTAQKATGLPTALAAFVFVYAGSATAVVGQGFQAAPLSAPSAANSFPVAPRVLASKLDEAPDPAVINYSNGQLTIHATNSSLRAILDTLQAQTGTKIDGLTRDERIYGQYGPGNAQAVLASLLDDSGYNVLIAGRNADGAPREITLSTRSAASVTPTQGVTQAAAENDDTEEAEPAPSAFAPPQPMPTTPAAAPGSPQQVKTPQQMLEELQKIRQNAAQAAAGGGQAPQ